MAEGTTTPRRTRTTPAKSAPAKPAAVKPAPVKTEIPATEPMKIELHHVADTKQYAKFEPDAALRGTVVGSVYVPLGTARVIVAIVPGAEAPAE